MAKTINDDFSKLFGETGHNRRFENWLWLVLNDHYKAKLKDDLFAGEVSRQLMADFIQGDEIDPFEIKIFRDKDFVLESSLEWIINEERQNKWIINYIEKAYNFAIYGMPRLQCRDLTVATIDMLRIKLDEKDDFVKEMKNSWRYQIQEDSLFDWFKKEDQDVRYETAYQFTIKNRHSISNYRRPSSFSSHNELLMFIDDVGMSVNEKKYWLDGVKKKYSQQNFRKNSIGKKQYNFILAESTISMLDELSAQYSLSRAEIIDLLIRMEATKPTHLPERLRYVKSMTNDAI
jgi:hypothetical protein